MANFSGYTVFDGLVKKADTISKVVVHEYDICNRAKGYLFEKGHKVKQFREHQVLISKVPCEGGGE